MPYHRTKNLATVSANGCLSQDQCPKSGSQLQFVSGAPGARVVEGEKELRSETLARRQTGCLHVCYTNAQRWRATISSGEVVGNPDAERRWTQIGAQISKKCNRGRCTRGCGNSRVSAMPLGHSLLCRYAPQVDRAGTPPVVNPTNAYENLSLFLFSTRRN